MQGYDLEVSADDADAPWCHKMKTMMIHSFQSFRVNEQDQTGSLNDALYDLAVLRFGNDNRLVCLGKINCIGAKDT